MTSLALLSGLAVTLLIAALWRTFGPQGTVKTKRKVKARLYSDGAVQAPLMDFTKKHYFSEVDAFNKFLSRRAFAHKIDDMLKRARMPISVSLFLLSCLTLGMLTFMILRNPMGPLYAAPVATSAAFAPYLFLKWRERIYLKKFAEYLPNALSVISNSIKVGHGLEAALEAVARTVPYPVSEEFQTVRAEMKLGQPLQVALQNLYERIGSVETKIFATGVAIHEELGGNLSEVLTNLEHTIRDRFALAREIKVMSAQGILSMWILTAAPLVLTAIWLFNAPEALFAFAASEGGRMGIGLAVVCQSVALIWTRQIIRIND